MPTLTIEYTTDAERLELERAIAHVQEMRRGGATAPHGTVLDACEAFALESGRALLRDNLAATAQARIDAEQQWPAGDPRDGTPER
jgi:hypothetical protein